MFFHNSHVLATLFMVILNFLQQIKEDKKQSEFEK